MRRLLSLVAASKWVKGQKTSLVGDQEYMLEVSYKTGEMLRIRPWTERASGNTFLEVIGFWDCHYVPPPQLVPFMQAVLRR